MPERESLAGKDPCVLSEIWKVDQATMTRVVQSADQFLMETGFDPQIISGFRTRQQQSHLARTGRPAAPDAVSTHRSCPATGVDVALGPAPTRVLKAIWGRIVVLNGLRWGGGGPVDDGGIPIDWGHVDRGPRQG